MPNAAAEIPKHPATLAALVIFMLASLGISVIANRVTSKKSGFLQKYFLGNRSLGALAVALTAAVMSGGTFLGFPSMVYSFGWVVGLWIASYMIAPVTILGTLGKRIGQLSRRTGAITLPDLFRERYGSPALGFLTSIFIIVFLTVFLVPQFKSGGLIMKIVLPSSSYAWVSGDDVTAGSTDGAYLVGLLIFSATVILYTAVGGFLAAVWTDVFQSIIMAIGVLILFPLAMNACGGLEKATFDAMSVKTLGDGFAFGPGAGFPGRQFHPITLAISFFVMWAITGMGQPSTLVRLMAFRDSRTLRWSIIYVSIYNIIIYIPLILIFVAARSILPDLAKPDEVMPRLVTKLANPYVAGIILAAPYGAVMSTVSGFLLLISSGIVRDVYQRFINPVASEKRIELLSYIFTVGVGVLVALIAIKPPQLLQLLVVFASAGMAAAFLVPAMMAAFWRRATATGAITAMIAGVSTILSLYVAGFFVGDQKIGPPAAAFGAYYLLGFDPCVWGLLASAVGGVVGTLLSAPPDPARVSLMFDVQPASAPAPATLDLHPEKKAAIADL